MQEFTFQLSINLLHKLYLIIKKLILKKELN